MRLSRVVSLAHLALAAGVCAVGPQVWAQRSTLSKVEFRGAQGLVQADLEAVAGVHAGDKVSADQMRAAAQRLIDTGFFDDVHVDSKGTGSALDLIFVLKPVPTEQITKVAFTNFVWLTPEELRATVHQVVPLFRDELPESGTALDQIDAALQAALVAKGVANAVVGHAAAMPSTEQPVHVLTFEVERPFVEVRELRLQGVDAALAPQLKPVAARLRGGAFVAGESEMSTLGRLLEPYRDAGYLAAQATDLQLTVVPETENKVGVDLSARMEPGPVYHVGTVSFAGSPLVSSADFAAGTKLHPGDVASRKALLETLRPIETAYQKQGYAEMYVNPGLTLGAQTHTASYALAVVPGKQYRIRTVSVLGLSPEARAQFDQGWLLKPGDLYDPGYVQTFLTKNTALRGLAGYAGGFKAASDPTTKLVDLTVNFVPVKGKG